MQGNHRSLQKKRPVFLLRKVIVMATMATDSSEPWGTFSPEALEDLSAREREKRGKILKLNMVRENYVNLQSS